ncbi:winged helix DNA-binding protein [Herbihabitans rhizosphaerae]|uniref:Winged helix DNA-binding protein n=1 Tax=Herbihabitans rhizosphaerae TaxID=1872711 RepID=A0A4Q7KUN2_9PSEU|nr:winged helix DNA-binding domain-containing protein [Herbihabitans rhizosphaerae]RZS40708.1 winged helix DNA-binding protein [Herbihabitans rhizosphaerae]
MHEDGSLAARAAAQGLAARGSDVAEAVRRVVALQGQDVRASRLAVRARTAGLTASDVDDAIAARKVVRTWAMRGTLHLLAAEDVRWIVGLLGPRFAHRTRGRREQLGLDESSTARGVAALTEVLSGAGPLTRAKIVSRLAGHGVVLDPKSQAPAHLLGYAALTGVLCRGPEAPKDESTYVLLDEWLPPAPVIDEEEALVRLASRYLVGHAPADAADFATWAGLPLGRARSAFTAIGDHDRPAASVPERGVVRLLGHFDAYLLGYASRVPAVPPEHDRKIQSGGGFVMPAVCVDGRVVGTWRLDRSGGRGTVSVQPFGVVGSAVRQALCDDADDVSRFLGIEVDLAIP